MHVQFQAEHYIRLHLQTTAINYWDHATPTTSCILAAISHDVELLVWPEDATFTKKKDKTHLEL